jgi:hypothetical protein
MTDDDPVYVQNMVDWMERMGVEDLRHRTFAWDILHYRVFRVPFTQRRFGVRRLRSLLNERFGWFEDRYRHKLR